MLHPVDRLATDIFHIDKRTGSFLCNKRKKLFICSEIIEETTLLMYVHKLPRRLDLQQLDYAKLITFF